MDEREMQSEIERLEREIIEQTQQLQLARMGAATGCRPIPSPTYTMPYYQAPYLQWAAPIADLNVSACCCDSSMAKLTDRVNSGMLKRTDEKPKEEKPKEKEKIKPEEKQSKGFWENLIETISDFFWDYII